MTAIRGATASRNAGVLDVRLPWCGTFSTAASTRAAVASTLASARASMSPVSSTLKSPCVSLSVSEVSFSSGTFQVVGGWSTPSISAPPSGGRRAWTTRAGVALAASASVSRCHSIPRPGQPVHQNSCGR
jgi:hypothetical protein